MDTPTSLALPSAFPKARKEDIISAMVERLRQKHVQEAAVLEKAQDEQMARIRSEVDCALRQAMEGGLLPTDNVDISPNRDGTVDITISNFGSPAIKEMVDAYRVMPSMRSFDAGTIRKRITEQMSGRGPANERVAALLGSEEAVRKLDEAIEAIGM